MTRLEKVQKKVIGMGIKNLSFSFPPPIPLITKLRDVLDRDVDEKYFLSKRITEYYIEHTKRERERGNSFAFRPIKYEEAEVTNNALSTKEGSRPESNYIIYNE